MRELLPLLPRPSHYAGVEEGCCDKTGQDIRLHIALAFPDAYEVGMSYLGQKILYDIVNSHPQWWAERVMAPEKEASDIIRGHGAVLATLESDTPLNQLHAVCFSITHELCFTDVLHMLDLGHIPLRSEERSQDMGKDPLIMAGGGAMFGAEPLTPFIDLAALGDGEEILPELLSLLEQALACKWTRHKFLEHAARIPGIYVPRFFTMDELGNPVPVNPGYRPTRRVVTDLDMAPYPVRQVLPVGAVHNRLALEIARGCTRGCRFCHAGIIYRPVRERSVPKLSALLDNCLDQTGFEEASYLSLSTGDYSALKCLCSASYERCAREHVTLSLPSLRVGSIDDDILALMASLRRTGITLAPEAGSQRLRNVINKGITEEELLDHARLVAANGWKQVKLYFMIGLPTESDEDLEAIYDLCCKVRDIARPDSPCLQVSAALSTFVPKPFTPFQWEAQIDRQETVRRINLLRALFKGKKNLRLRWHEPGISYVEGVMSRGDRKLAAVVEKAYAKGAIFSAWTEKFRLEPWLEAFAECGIDPDSYLAARDQRQTLPWSHLECGVSQEFLRRENERARREQVTPDCRYATCVNCGACDTRSAKSLLAGNGETKSRLVNSRRDQQAAIATDLHVPAQMPARPTLPKLLAAREARYRLWHKKTGQLAYLSQLELQAVVERALRRARIPVSFSQGYHPLPLVSFGRALPVGVESNAEWIALTLAKRMSASHISGLLNAVLRPELAIWKVEAIDLSGRCKQAIMEKYTLIFGNDAFLPQAAESFAGFSERCEAPYEKTGKKGAKLVDLRPFLHSWKICVEQERSTLEFTADWRSGYISPLVLARQILGAGSFSASCLKIMKTSQIFADGQEFGAGAA